MRDNRRTIKLPGILLIVCSGIGILLWLVMLFFALLLGGSPGPGYERTVPLFFAGIILLGLFSAAAGLAGGIASMCGARKPAFAMIIIAALLGAAGSVPLFLLDLAPVGVFYGLVGVLPPAVCFVLMKALGEYKA